MIPEKYVRQFLDFNERHRLFDAGEKILLAVSGGVDSMVMLALFREVGQTIGIVHCNFKLRGEESDGDETFVATHADSLKVPFFSKSFDTDTVSEREGISIQMAARNLRYQYFESLLAETEFQKLATAHHVDDCFETLMLNLAHGSGFQGVAAIRPTRDAYIRPLLCFSRPEILEMAQQLKLDWREDSSNLQNGYERNKIRHHLLPLMFELNPSFSQTFKDTTERLWAAGSVLESSIADWQKQRVKVQGKHTEVIVDLNEKFFVFEYLKLYAGIGYRSFQQLWQSFLKNKPGKVFYTASHCINLDRQRILVSSLEEMQAVDPLFVHRTDEYISLPGAELKLQILSRPQQLEKAQHVALLDLDKLKFPLEIRSWRTGDSFRPLGLNGQKKLSDFMIDAKIPVNLKSRMLVLLSGGQIAWLIGYRIDDRFKVTEHTQSVLRLELC